MECTQVDLAPTLGNGLKQGIHLIGLSHIQWRKDLRTQFLGNRRDKRFGLVVLKGDAETSAPDS